MANKDVHMSLSKRQIIDTRIVTCSSKKSIADTVKKLNLLFPKK